MAIKRLEIFSSNEYDDPYPVAAEVDITPELCQRVRELAVILKFSQASTISDWWMSEWGHCEEVVPDEADEADDEWGWTPADPLQTSGFEHFAYHEIRVSCDGLVRFDCINKYSGDFYWTHEVDVSFFNADLDGRLAAREAELASMMEEAHEQTA